MGGLLIIGAVVIGIALIAMKGKQVAGDFSVKIVGTGIPKITNWIVSLPLTVRFNNPLPISVPLQKFEMNVFMLQGSTWQHVARLEDSMTIPSGVSEKVVTPAIDMRSFLSNALNTITSALTTRSIKFRTDITATAPGGITLPTQTEITDLSLPNG